MFTDAGQQLRTARRSGAEMLVSLRQRRQWFAEDPVSTTGGDTSAGTGNTETETPDKTVPYDRFQAVNKAKNDAEAELKKLRDADEARKLKEQAEAGKFEDVIKALQPKAERADALEKALQEYLNAEVAEIPEAMRSLVPQGDITAQLGWIKQAKAAQLFTRKPLPPLDGNRQGDRRPDEVKISDAQKMMAAIATEHGYPIKAEDLAKRQQALEEARKRKPEKREE